MSQQEFNQQVVNLLRLLLAAVQSHELHDLPGLHDVEMELNMLQAHLPR
jgi:hypothetical protein